MVTVAEFARSTGVCRIECGILGCYRGSLLLSTGLPPETDSGRDDSFRSRRPTLSDGAAMWRLATESTLDDNSPYAYLLWSDLFSSTSRVAVDESDRPIGFVMGLRVPERPDCLFIWQIAVDDSARGRGVASQLLDDLWTDVDGIRFLEATVTPSNGASDRLFRSFGVRHDGGLERSLVYDESVFPAPADADHAHEAEYLYRIGPITLGA